MKYLMISIIAISLVIGCSSEKKSQSEVIQNWSKESDTSQFVQQNQFSSIQLVKFDSLVQSDIKKLSEKYKWIPYYGKIDNKIFYITANKKDENADIKGIKFGLVDSLHSQLLDTTYDKISNPDLVIKDCFEISNGSMVGLYNYRTHEILYPQFDYILPSQNKITDLAYGYKNDGFYVINKSDLRNYSKQNIDLVSLLKSIHFDVLKLNESMMFDSYNVYYTNDVNEGNGVVIIPSFLKAFNLFQNDKYTDIILPDRIENTGFGTEQAKINSTFYQQIKSSITTFVVDAYEYGVDARGYTSDSKKMIIYNKDASNIRSINLWDKLDEQYPCHEYDFKIIGDSLIETKSTQTKDDNFYDYEPRYNHYLLTKDGEIKYLNSNRHFSFTKFVIIEDTYFHGCFAKYISASEKDDSEGNMWISSHLSYEELDLMRNEIFAEYGLKFKSEKWQKYFSDKPWYSPRYDDVNDKLSAIDKANLKEILKRQGLMKNDEIKFTKKRQIKFYAAG